MKVLFLLIVLFLAGCYPVLRVEANECLDAYERVYAETDDRDAAAEVYLICITGDNND